MTSEKSVTVDNLVPSVSSVSLSTNNAGTLFDNVTGNARDNDSVARFGDNVTLKFETSERVINPVTINGVEKNATRQLINGGSDISGMKLEPYTQ